MSLCEELKNDIIRNSKIRGIDPYRNSFKPGDLGLNASDYGSFSDHCDKRETQSASWCGCGTLTCVQKSSNGKPLKYKLLK